MKKIRNKWSCCLFGCLGTFVMCLLFIGTTTWWLTKKGEFEVNDTIYFPESEMYGQMTISSEDKVLVDFLVEQIRKHNTQQNQAMAEALPWLPIQDWNDEKARSDVEKMLPMSLEFTAMTSREEFGVAIGISNYNNLVRIMFGVAKMSMRGEGLVEEYQGREFLRLADDHNPDNAFFIGLQNSIIYFSKTSEYMGRMLTNQIKREEISAMDNPLDGLNQDHPFYMYLIGNAIQPDLLIWQRNTDENAFTDEQGFHIYDTVITRVAVDLRVETQEALSGNIFVDCTPSEQVESMLQQWGADFKERFGPTLEAQVMVIESGYRVSYRVTDLDRLLEQEYTIDTETDEAPAQPLEGEETSAPAVPAEAESGDTANETSQDQGN